MLFLLLVVLPAPAQIPALDLATTGKLYVIAFPDTTTNINDPYFITPISDALSLFIYSAANTEVSITGRNEHKRVSLRGGRFEIIPLNGSGSTSDNSIVTVSGAISPNTFRVESSEPIIVYCSMQTAFGSDMWTPVPVEQWGKEYHVATMPGELVTDMELRGLRFKRSSDVAPAEMLIVAAYDGTTINIYPNGKVMPPTAPRSVTLNANQSYQLQSLTHTDSTTQADAAGSLIVANRPIGVISGNTRAQVREVRSAFTNNTMKNLLVEWLPSVEQYGREFVYLPSWDTQRSLGLQTEKPGQKRKLELVRMYGSSKTPSKVYYHGGSGPVDSGSLMSRTFDEYETDALTPRYIRTEQPAQGMMTSTPTMETILEMNSVLGLRIYDTWSPYMMELVPREQWGSFAPYFAPTFPDKMRHYINVVADTGARDRIFDKYGSPFQFNMGRIPGSPLMWGTMEIVAGQTHYLEADRGITFSAYQYGIRKGTEYYSADTTEGAPKYQEVMALAYGFPLAPRRTILRPADSLRIDTTRRACEFAVKIRAVNANPVGLRSVELAPGSSNARLELSNPAGPGGVIGLSEVELAIVPIAPDRDASGALVITDRTGKTSTVPFSYKGDQVKFSPENLLAFDDVEVNDTGDTTVTITNTSGKAMCINGIRMRYGNQALSVVSTTPAGPALVPTVPVSLLPGEQIQVRIKAAPLDRHRLYVDTLRVMLCCSEVKLPVHLSPAVPCLSVGDLDFGVMIIGQQVTRELRICNEGRGYVTFDNPPGDSALTWLNGNFLVRREQLDSLRTARLGPGECITIQVAFKAQKADTISTTARLWASTRNCRDTSVWKVLVRPRLSGVQRETEPAGGMRLSPNPSSGTVAIQVTAGAAGHLSLEIYNSLGETVATLADGFMSGGEHTFLWDGSAEPPGLYYCRMKMDGRSTTESVLLQR